MKSTLYVIDLYAECSKIHYLGGENVGFTSVVFPPKAPLGFIFCIPSNVLYLIGAPQGPIKKWGNGYLEGENMKRSIVEAIKRAAYLINKIEDYEKEETEQIMRLEDVQRALSEAREEFAEVKELLWVEMRGI